MIKLTRKAEFIINAVFVAVELALLFVILFADINVDVVCFITVCLAFLHGGAFIIARKKGWLFLIALLLTVVADVFLVLRYTKTKAYADQAVAMTVFSVVQLCYFLYELMQTESVKIRTIHVIVRIIVSILAVVLTVVVLKNNANFMLVATMFYFVNLLLNTIFAFVDFKRFNLMAIGLAFFVICDIFIGLSVAVESIITVSENSFLYKMAYPSFNVAWLFYVFSQTLLSLYVARNRNDKTIVKLKTAC